MKRLVHFKRMTLRQRMDDIRFKDLAVCLSVTLDDNEIDTIAQLLMQDGTWEIRWNYAGFSQGHYVPGPALKAHYGIKV